MSTDLKLRIESLSFDQAMLFMFIHERRRHEADIAAINADIKRLADRGVTLPDFKPEEYDIWIEV